MLRGSCWYPAPKCVLHSLRKYPSLQVAASAEHHVVVKKALDSEGRALTRVVILLQEQDRLAEVAAMMGVGRQEAMQVLQASRV